MSRLTVHVSLGRRSRILIAAMILPALLIGPLVGSAMASSPPNPEGNNGTVKIHDGAGEPANGGIEPNQPHVCTFHIHLMQFDSDRSGGWWIQSWPPTGDMTTVLTGSYTTDSNGEFKSDVLSLPNGHYKLFLEGRNGHNIKHKVFWVACPPPTPGTTGNGPTPEPTHHGLPSTTTIDATPTDSSGPALALTLGVLSVLALAASLASRRARRLIRTRS